MELDTRVRACQLPPSRRPVNGAPLIFQAYSVEYRIALVLHRTHAQHLLLFFIGDELRRENLHHDDDVALLRVDELQEVMFARADAREDVLERSFALRRVVLDLSRDFDGVVEVEVDEAVDYSTDFQRDSCVG